MQLKSRWQALGGRHCPSSGWLVVPVHDCCCSRCCSHRHHRHRCRRRRCRRHNLPTYLILPAAAAAVAAAAAGPTPPTLYALASRPAAHTKQVGQLPAQTSRHAVGNQPAAHALNSPLTGPIINLCWHAGSSCSTLLCPNAGQVELCRHVAGLFPPAWRATTPPPACWPTALFPPCRQPQAPHNAEYASSPPPMLAGFGTGNPESNPQDPPVHSVHPQSLSVFHYRGKADCTNAVRRCMPARSSRVTHHGRPPPKKYTNRFCGKTASFSVLRSSRSRLYS